MKRITHDGKYTELPMYVVEVTVTRESTCFDPYFSRVISLQTWTLAEWHRNVVKFAVVEYSEGRTDGVYYEFDTEYARDTYAATKYASILGA